MYTIIPISRLYQTKVQPHLFSLSQTEVDDETMPTDQLTRVAMDWCKGVGSDVTTLSGLLDSKDPNILKGMTSHCQVDNFYGLSSFTRLNVFHIFALYGIFWS